MWEDCKTGIKWVKVTKCFFPDDLPGNIGHPCISEVNEVIFFIFIHTSLYINWCMSLFLYGYQLILASVKICRWYVSYQFLPKVILILVIHAFVSYKLFISWSCNLYSQFLF